MLGSSAYEIWVRRLREWGKDPSVSLSDLPPITPDENMLTKELVDRLVTHITKAQQNFMELFESKLQSAFDENDPQKFERAYHNLQHFYAHRFVLARHQSLPKALSDQLEALAVQELKNIQSEVEGAISKGSGRGMLSGSTGMLGIVKQNSLLQLLHADTNKITDESTTGIKASINLIPTYDPYQD